MKIGLDVRMIESSGIGTTIRGLLDHLTPEQRKKLVLLHLPGWINPYECEAVEAPFPVYGLQQHWSYPKLLDSLKLDLFHMPHYDVPLHYKGRFIATVHDLIHYLFPAYSRRPFSRLYSSHLLKHVAAKAAGIITVSENTRLDLERAFTKTANKTRVIYPAVDSVYAPVKEKDLDEKLRSVKLEKGYILYVGNLRPSKNTPGLLSAYEIYRRRAANPHPLVLVGRNTYGPSLALPDGVRLMGEVPFADLPYYYSGAGLFVFPSFYEGFGLPPLEAMACGTPVLVSHTASLPEVCGNAAAYVYPESPGDIAEEMLDLLSSPSRLEELRKKGFENVKRFDWKIFASRTFRFYEDCLK